MKFQSITRKIGQQVLAAKKHSPALMLAGGIAGVGVTVVLACKATLKVEPILDELESNLDKVQQVHDANLTTEKEAQKTRVAAYMKAGGKLAKLYGPALMVGIPSIVALIGAHNIQNNRIAGFAAAYTGAQKAFAKYRERVVNELGVEKDREFRFGTDEREIVIETEQGPEVIKAKHAAQPDGTIEDEYSRWFSRETSKDWNPQPEYNHMFLRAAQNYANRKLESQGWLLLNDVLEQLGMQKTSTGAVTGWTLDGSGDGFVDFGIWNGEDVGLFHDFMTGREGGIWLDFNVEGDIWKKIDKISKRK